MIIVTLLLSTANIMAQVKDVNKNIKKDKENSSKTKSAEMTSSSTNNNDGWFVGLVVGFFHYTIGAAQRAALENVDIYPERVSLETFASLGFEFTAPTNYFQTGIRGNWGIIGTDFKYSNLNDPTGRLKSIDWMVVVIRVPIKNFKIDWGIGFIGIINEEQSYGNSSIGFDWRLPNAGVNIASAYQWSGRTSLGSRYKESFNIRVDYNVYSYQRLHVSPLVEYSYQNYFNETRFSLFSVGVVIRLY